MVAAPGRVSMMTGWPQLSVIFCPSTRARMSVDPPGANGTMILIGFSGYLSAGDWAQALLAAKAVMAARTAAWIVWTHHAPVCFPTSLSLCVFGPVMPRGLSAGYHILWGCSRIGGS